MAASESAPNVRAVGRVLFVVPLLVEYSEDDDTGCGFGAIVIISAIAVAVLLLRLVAAQTQR